LESHKTKEHSFITVPNQQLTFVTVPVLNHCIGQNIAKKVLVQSPQEMHSLGEDNSAQKLWHFPNSSYRELVVTLTRGVS
jgi:hypothetical protein